MGTSDIRKETLVHACIAAGDDGALAKRLGVPVESLFGWLLGESDVPPEVFARAVELVLERSNQLVRQNQTLRERIRSKEPLSERAFALALIESQSGILERLAHGVPLEAVLDMLVLAIESQSEGMLGAALLVSKDGRIRHGAAPSLPRGYVNGIDGMKVDQAAGACGTVVYLGKPVVSADIDTDPLWRDYRELALEHGLRAFWSAPIVSPRGEMLGAFALYYREPRQPQPRERHLVEVGAQLAAIAIGSATQAPAAGAAIGRATLSVRELQVVSLILRGEPIKRIASALNMAPSTVYTHRARIFEKLGIDSNVRLVQYALDRRMFF